MGNTTKTKSAPSGGLSAESQVWTYLAVAVFLAAALLAWSNTFLSPFIFDDDHAIVTNEALHHFWPPWRSAWAPAGATIAGRPVPAFTFALNFAVHGLSLPGYHVVNLLVHILAALVLFGVVRRTLRLQSMRERFGSAASPIALTVALLWLLHPLTTQSVTYINRRIELMLGLFFFLTLYASIRAFESPVRRWRVVAVAACALGMGTSETMAVAPLVVLLYDRAFASDGWRETLRRRAGLYAALAACWLILLPLQMGSPRGEAVGFHMPLAASVSYLNVQTHFILHYLLLTFRPWGLVFDYGTLASNAALGTPLDVSLVAALAVAAAALLAARPRWGFLPAMFFLVLAPSSSVVPLPLEVAAENRMYVPLAALVAGVTVLAFVFLRRLARRISPGPTSVVATTAGTLLVLAAATLLGALTYARNNDYRSELTIWVDTLTKVPNNPRAWYGKGIILNMQGYPSEAISCYDKTLEIDPLYADAWNNKGIILNSLGRSLEAMACFDKTLEINPRDADAWSNKGGSLNILGRSLEAMACFDKALAIEPRDADAWNNKGVSLNNLGRSLEAMACFDKALELNPRFAKVWYNKALAHENLAHRQAAIRCLHTYLDMAASDPAQRAWIPQAEACLRELENK
jgi:tetratricopeptide (TPR) repeat protein